MKPCCIFSYDEASTAIKNFDYLVIKDLGKKVHNNDGTIKHSNYVWDDGGRKIIQCKKCHAIFLYQWSEFHSNYGDQDSHYDNYFLVNNLDEAIYINNMYGGLELETNHKGLRLWNSDDVWCWTKVNNQSI